MIIALIIVVIILLIIVYAQYVSNKKIGQDVDYVVVKLREIVENDSTERVRVITNNKAIKNLTIEINNLLDYNHKNKIKFNRAEISMRKMLSNISHDLKTPLTVVLGLAETLKVKGRLYDEEHLMVDKIHGKTMEVLALINKFFDLAKLESGDKDIPLTKVNISEICRKNILDFYDSLSNKGFEVDINIPEKDVYGLGNIEALDRILNNLISNAIKYGGDGKFLGLRLKEDKEIAYIEIVDKGKGINESYKEAVFERMYTLEDSRNKNYQGSGLGLTITKKLVETLGGSININSKPYEETKFSFSLKKLNY